MTPDSLDGQDQWNPSICKGQIKVFCSFLERRNRWVSDAVPQYSETKRLRNKMTRLCGFWKTRMVRKQSVKWRAFCAIIGSANEASHPRDNLNQYQRLVMSPLTLLQQVLYKLYTHLLPLLTVPPIESVGGRCAPCLLLLKNSNIVCISMNHRPVVALAHRCSARRDWPCHFASVLRPLASSCFALGCFSVQDTTN